VKWQIKTLSGHKCAKVLTNPVCTSIIFQLDVYIIIFNNSSAHKLTQSLGQTSQKRITPLKALLV